ncbi:ubiquitin carboxyl-terminal hydrolase 48-like [Oratosquilla oratoria]|uniref:ubiquitin carboxyl-terminal hydrolase 48-like n=1 Tax=Oratosquilla oratoria TaxID=337810 RepID=UPI003F75C040
MKEKIGNELSYIKAGYRSDQWKWVLSLKNDNDEPITTDQLKDEHILRTYNLDRLPKNMPCVKKCTQNAWCLTELRNGSKEKGKLRPTDQPRDPALPLGLQNTANTCWINSALQGLYHLPWFRNLINSVDGFAGEESLSFMVYLLQAMFVEMEVHSNKAIGCTPGSVFESIGLFATREIMRKDADHEVLKCVSEFLENTIDNLMADPRLGPELGPLFSTTLTRLARWKCPNCETEHEIHLPPATFYTVGAYVSGDECPLDQCLMDLQTETQTGVSLVCGAGAGAQGGCGAKIKTDRIVTPKIQNLPRILVIRNNSLVDRDLKRRLHVVYPDTLDLTSHTLHHVAASYSLHAVIYHHGHWVKHFSAHVKTGEGKWFNFNDEHVSEVVNRSSSGNPTETHRNYFSVANIASKYKHRLGLRVSRGAFVWMYVLNDAQEEPKVLPPPESVVQYVLQKQQENKEVKHQQMAEIQSERKLLMERLAIRNPTEDYVLISEALLSAWLACDGPTFTPLPKQLAKPLCEHKLYSPRKIYDMKCIRAEEVESLFSVRCGIHVDESTRKLGLPVFLTPSQGPCRLCMVKAANHILFLEGLRNLYKNAKKEAKKVTEGPSVLIGSDTLENWPRFALKAYVKENGLDSYDVESDIDGTREGDTGDVGSAPTDAKSDQAYDLVTSGEHIASSDAYLCKTNVIASTAGDSERNGMDSGPSDNVPETKNSNGFYKNRDSSEGMVISSNELEKDSNNAKVTPSLSTKSISKNEDVKSCSEEKKKDTNSEEVEVLFNQELVCEHGLRSPKVSSCFVPEDIANQIMELCKNSLHPAMLAKDFDNCTTCEAKLDKSMGVCQAGIRLKKELALLIQEKKRPHPTRDVGSTIYVISREFFYDFKSFLRACDRLDLQVPVISEIENQSLFCKHNKLLYHTASMELHYLSQ